MAYPLLESDFFFRIGENPEGSMRRILEELGVKVVQISNFPLSLSGGTRMQIYVDLNGKDVTDVQFSLRAHRGYVCIPTMIYIGEPQPIPPPVPPPPDWLYEVETLKGVLVRDLSGNLLPEQLGRLISAGVTLKIYQELAQIGPNAVGSVYQNRGVINRDLGANIWIDASVVRRL